MQIRTLLNYCPDACPYLEVCCRGGDQVYTDEVPQMTTPLTVTCAHLKVCAIRLQAMQDMQKEMDETVKGGEDAQQGDDGDAQGQAR